MLLPYYRHQYVKVVVNYSLCFEQVVHTQRRSLSLRSGNLHRASVRVFSFDASFYRCTQEGASRYHMTPLYHGHHGTAVS